MKSDPHIWLALSPHGWGHAGMSSPLVDELRRRWPGLRLTVQTSLPAHFLASRFGAFTHVSDIPDFGLRMVSATEVDVEASGRAYAALHADFDAVVEREARRLAAARPDIVLANVPYVTVAAAARAGIPVVAFSSLNWADMFAATLRSIPDAARIEAEIRAAYAQASVFLRCTPGQEMTLPNLCDVGLVASAGTSRGSELAAILGAERVGLVAFGGLDLEIDLARWPVMAGWHWLTTLPNVPSRPDLSSWERPGMGFRDLIASAAVVVTKPGYGTFSEAALVGTPVVYLPRPGWPECPHLENWLDQHTRILEVAMDDLLSPDLGLLLQKLFFQPERPLARPDGVGRAANAVEAVLAGKGVACGRS